MVEIKGTSDSSHDLNIEILSRLPAKILCRFRRVSKEWHNLLARDKKFAAKQIKWSKQNPLLLIRRYVSNENGEVSKSKATVKLTSVEFRGKHYR